MVRKHIQEYPFTRGTNHLLKQVAFMLRRRILSRRPSDKAVEHVCATFLTDLTLVDFSFWGFLKDNMYIPPMPMDLQEIRDRTVNAIALVNVTFLKTVGQN
jgi:hypothetical protein